PGRTAWLVMSSERIAATQAAEWGLVDIVVDDLDAGIEQVAGTLAAQSPTAGRELKRLLHETRQRRDDAAEARAFWRLHTSEDGREGIAAFLEKRPPRWAR